MGAVRPDWSVRRELVRCGRRAKVLFVTQDYDLFFPPDPDNLVRAWTACEDVGLELWSNDEPLDRPRDRWLAERVIARRALTRITGPSDLLVDITLVMKGYDFETVWNERRTFAIEGVEIPTAGEHALGTHAVYFHDLVGVDV